jgi:hypothetical protein
VIPAVYTPALVAELQGELLLAEALANQAGASSDNEVLRDRLRFTRLGFEVLSGYVAMIAAAATQADYVAAASAGEATQAARLELARMNPTFTTRVVGPAAETADLGPAWLPGEVEQYRKLGALVGGPKGDLVARLPLTWSFRAAEPLSYDWTYAGPAGPTDSWDLGPALEQTTDPAWQRVRTDLYLQAQGVRSAGGDIELGHYWYRADVNLPALRGSIHLMFPGLFNECWLYMNGRFAAHRPYEEPWWKTDYRFEWDVDVSQSVRPGRNVIALRGFNPHHFAGMFRRPFMYRAIM